MNADPPDPSTPASVPALSAPSGRLHVEEVMGMAVTIDIRDRIVDVEATDAAIADVVGWLHHVDRTFSTYKADSPISRLGRGELGLDDVSDEIRDVLRACERLRVDSGGAFDVFAVPAPNGTTLDPSGLVKGWSVELAADRLGQHGAVNFTINAGGDIAVRGEPEPGRPWRVGIRHPDDAARLAMVIEATGPCAVATSATYERGAHIIDPRDGRPTTTIASATVVGPDLGTADAYATVVFVLGADGLAWIEGHPGYEACVIGHDDSVRWTPGFARWRARR